jgi:hypothetical protein
MSYRKEWIQSGRDFVCSGAARKDLAVLQPQAFFRREKTLSLNKGTFDLSIINGRIDGLPNILI